MRTWSRVRPQSSGKGSSRSTYWVRKTPAEPGAPTTTSAWRAIFARTSYEAKKTAHTGPIVRPARLAAGRRPGVHFAVPGELDHATGLAEATSRTRKGRPVPAPTR